MVPDTIILIVPDTIFFGAWHEYLGTNMSAVPDS
jgi:hypothetical protein